MNIVFGIQLFLDYSELFLKSTVRGIHPEFDLAHDEKVFFEEGVNRGEIEGLGTYTNPSLITKGGIVSIKPALMTHHHQDYCSVELSLPIFNKDTEVELIMDDDDDDRLVGVVYNGLKLDFLTDHVYCGDLLVGKIWFYAHGDLPRLLKLDDAKEVIIRCDDPIDYISNSDLLLLAFGELEYYTNYVYFDYRSKIIESLLKDGITSKAEIEFIRGLIK